LIFTDKSGRKTTETVAQLANELIGDTDKEKEALRRANINSNDIANIIREEFKKSGKKVKENIGGLSFKVQEKVYDKQRALIIGMAKNQVKNLIKKHRLEYFKNGQVSYMDKDGNLEIGDMELIAGILIDKSGRNQMVQYGILEEDIVEIIKNKGQ
jgi:hypothetical protein